MMTYAIVFVLGLNIGAIICGVTVYFALEQLKSSDTRAESK